MTDLDPKVSILIPVYNREHLIGPCIDSALSQTFRDFELVVCDNASTDGTWAVCERYAAEDARVRVFRNEENIGPVWNWRRCLDEARGELGKLLFSDDLIYPSYLSQTVPYLDDREIGFVFTAVHIGPEKEKGGICYAWKEAPAIVASRRFIEESLLTNRILVSPGAALFRLNDLRRNLMDEIPSPTLSGFKDTGAGPDVLCYLLTASDYPKIAHLPEPLCLFRAHDGSITIASDGKLLDNYWQARLWFAETRTDKTLFARTRVRAWVSLCRHAGRYLSYRATLEAFTKELPRPGIRGWFLIVWTGFRILKRHLRSGGKSRRRAI